MSMRPYRLQLNRTHLLYMPAPETSEGPTLSGTVVQVCLRTSEQNTHIRDSPLFSEEQECITVSSLPKRATPCVKDVLERTQSKRCFSGMQQPCRTFPSISPSPTLFVGTLSLAVRPSHLTFQHYFCPQPCPQSSDAPPFKCENPGNMVKVCGSLSATIVCILRKTSGSLPWKSQIECLEPRLFPLVRLLLRNNKCHAVFDMPVVAGKRISVWATHQPYSTLLIHEGTVITNSSLPTVHTGLLEG